MSHFSRPRHLSGVNVVTFGASMDINSMVFGKTSARALTLFCLSCALLAGCVTQTERIYPYERIPEDESVWEELRREFRGRDSTSTSESPSEPFYKRVAQSVQATVSGWFHEDSTHLSEEELAANRRRFERKRAQALEQLREQQEEAEEERR
jgi:hypothetical protein